MIKIMIKVMIKVMIMIMTIILTIIKNMIIPLINTSIEADTDVNVVTNSRLHIYEDTDEAGAAHRGVGRNHNDQHQ